MRYGRTLENGGNPIFEQQKDFLYAGAELDVIFLGIKGSIFRTSSSCCTTTCSTVNTVCSGKFHTSTLS